MLQEAEFDKLGSYHMTIDGLIEAHLMPRFEDQHKRAFQYVKDRNDRQDRYGFNCPGLKASKTNLRLEPNLLVLS